MLMRLEWEDKWPSERLLDLRKAYPRMNKPALRMLRYLFKGMFGG